MHSQISHSLVFALEVLLYEMPINKVKMKLAAGWENYLLKKMENEKDVVEIYGKWKLPQHQSLYFVRKIFFKLKLN